MASTPFVFESKLLYWGGGGGSGGIGQKGKRMVEGGRAGKWSWKNTIKIKYKNVFKRFILKNMMGKKPKLRTWVECPNSLTSPHVHPRP